MKKRKLAGDLVVWVVMSVGAIIGMGLITTACMMALRVMFWAWTGRF